MLFTLSDSHQYPVFTAIQRFKIFAEDLLPEARVGGHGYSSRFVCYPRRVGGHGYSSRLVCLFVTHESTHLAATALRLQHG